jgi:hypothetical protein
VHIITETIPCQVLFNNLINSCAKEFDRITTKGFSTVLGSECLIMEEKSLPKLDVGKGIFLLISYLITPKVSLPFKHKQPVYQN